MAAVVGGERPKFTQPLLLAPEKARPKLAICNLLKEQLALLCAHTVSVETEKKSSLVF